MAEVAGVMGVAREEAMEVEVVGVGKERVCPNNSRI